MIGIMSRLVTIYAVFDQRQDYLRMRSKITAEESAEQIIFFTCLVISNRMTMC